MKMSSSSQRQMQTVLGSDLMEGPRKHSVVNDPSLASPWLASDFAGWMTNGSG